MAETYTLISGKTLSYKGIFDLKGLYAEIDRFFHEKKWDKVEIENSETVEKNGKQTILELYPFKKINDYVKERIRIYMIGTEIKDVKVGKRKYQQGQLFFSFDAYLITDYKHYWEGKPLYYFIRVITDKFIRKSYTNEWSKETINMCNELTDLIRSFLNMHRYKITDIKEKPDYPISPSSKI